MRAHLEAIIPALRLWSPATAPGFVGDDTGDVLWYLSVEAFLTDIASGQLRPVPREQA